MTLLYPRPYRASSVEIAWFTWRDLHPTPMAGYKILPVKTPWWWRLPLVVRPHLVCLNLGFGALKVWWRGKEAR